MKCYGNNVHLLMSDMTVKNVKELQIGDLLMCDDSSIQPIISIRVYKGTGYEVEPINSDNFIIGEDHQLNLKSRGNRNCTYNKSRNAFMASWFDVSHVNKSKTFNIKDYNGDKQLTKQAAKSHCENDNRGQSTKISISKYINKTGAWKRNYCLYTVPVEFGYKEVYLDPYILGYWLGDGHSRGPEITTENAEVVAYFTEYAESIGHKLSKHKSLNT